MRERKAMMDEKSDAFIVTPGGIGTMEEFFEIFTLRQLRRHSKPIGILNTAGYYDELIQMLMNTAEKGLHVLRTAGAAARFRRPQEAAGDDRRRLE